MHVYVATLEPRLQYGTEFQTFHNMAAITKSIIGEIRFRYKTKSPRSVAAVSRP